METSRLETTEGDLLASPEGSGFSLAPRRKTSACAARFFDVQAINRGHVARACFDGLWLTSWSSPSGVHVARVPVALHVVLHAAGVMMMRLTATSDSWRRDAPRSPKEFAALNRAFWGGVANPSWEIHFRGGAPLRGAASVRGVLTAIFAVHRAAAGRQGDMGYERARTILEAYDSDGAQAMASLVAEGLARDAYPVAFGTHFEFYAGDHEPGECTGFAAQAACSLRSGAPASAMPAVVGVPTWLLGDDQGALLAEQRQVDDTIDALEPFSMQVVEYLAMQRGALRTVQRQTQAAITEAQRVPRSRLEAWNRTVAALSDDYILHNNAAEVIEPLQRYMTREDGLRDPAELEAQVRRNLASFRAGLDAADTRAGTLMSGLFGVLAGVALAGTIKRLLAAVGVVSQGGAEAFDRRYAELSPIIDLVAVMACALGAVWLYRRFSGQSRL